MLGAPPGRRLAVRRYSSDCMKYLCLPARPCRSVRASGQRVGMKEYSDVYYHIGRENYSCHYYLRT